MSDLNRVVGDRSRMGAQVSPISRGSGSASPTYFPPTWIAGDDNLVIFAPGMDVAMTTAASVAMAGADSFVTTDGMVAARAGSIVALTATLNKDVEVGAVTLRPTINGVQGTLALVISVGDGTIGAVTQDAGIDSYEAGDLIGMHIETTDDVSPTVFQSVLAFMQGLEASS